MDNFARYLVGFDIGLYSDLEEKCEEELLKEHRIKGEEKVASIAKMAQKHGITEAIRYFTMRLEKVLQVLGI